MSDPRAGEQFLREFLSTYELHDLDKLWTFYCAKCRFPVLERFGIEPTWSNYRSFMTTFVDAFPDLHHHIESVVVDGDAIWALYTVTGTHQGPLRGIQPTGKRIRYSMVAMYQVVDKHITRADLLADNLLMLRQLGVLPA